MKVAIIKYNAGNIYSVVHALKRLGVEPMLTDNAEELLSADRVLFPGQGEARQAMGYLREHRLDQVIRNLKQPVLGICIGQQLLCRHSEEGDVDCIGIFDADVKRFCPERHEDKVPCMGWNGLRVKSEKLKVKSEKLIVNEVKSEELRVNEVNEGVNPLFQGVNDGDYVYFVHSYYVPLCTDTIATANYILPYSAALHKDNFYTCQFHPEKSGAVGEQILRNFLKLK